MYLKEISRYDFDKFQFESKTFYQTSKYGEVMTNHKFKDIYVGFFNEENTMVASSLILIQKIVFNFYFAYAPRGFLIDFKDSDLLKDFVQQLKKFLNTKNVLYLKIDPRIEQNETNLKVITDLKKIGFEHLGFNLYFESLKPRWNCILNTNNIDDIFKSFNKKTKNKIKNAIKKGVYVEKSNNIDTFYELINTKQIRKKEYYIDLQNNFKDDFEIYFAKLNTYNFITNFHKLHNEESEKNAEFLKNMNSKNALNKKMESDKLLDIYKNYIKLGNKLFNLNKEDIVIATNAIIKQNNELIFLIDGIDKNFKEFNANYLLKWEIIKNNKNINIFNFNAISGNFKKNSKYYNLYEFKKGFNTKIVEYIGEFNIIVNPLKVKTYIIFKNLENLFIPNLKKR